MGTYKSLRILANTSNEDELRGIVAIINDANAGDYWRRFGPETKWWPDELMRKLTKKYPNVMFRLDYDGVKAQSEFYQGDKVITAHWVLPYFPSQSKFNSGIRAEKKYRQREKEMKEKAQAAVKVKKAADIERQEREQLEALKAKYG